MSLHLTSPAFVTGERIPSQYTCDGNDISPPLHWEDAPGKTESFALICDDPDAPRGDWIHWLVWNIPAESRDLPENFGMSSALPPYCTFGQNDFGKKSYGGPCPPSGKHRYYFTLYALDTVIECGDKCSKNELLTKMKGHIQASSQVMGVYSH